ncbi:MAG: glycosyltransferase family 4 protein [Burkholderiales bacterium]|nr:glycosyltransferase family 4 protein [Burkholderiales bacterium]
MQRILLILTEFPPRIGGMQTHAAYLSRHLAEHGYCIEVLTHRSSDPALKKEAAAYDRAQPFAIHRVLGRLSYQHNLQLIARHAKNFSPDLIYSSTVFYGVLQERTGIPVICRSVGNDVMRPWLGYPYRFASGCLNSPRLERLVHGWLEKDWYPDWAEALFRKKRETLMAQSARAASAILANSEFTARLLRDAQVPSERIHTVVGGVDSQRFYVADACKLSARRALGLPESGFLLMTACRLVAKKGIDLLLDALPRLRQTVPQVHLVVVGDGKYRARFERHCAEQGMNNVIFAGRVPHEDIHRYYTACDLFILASRESINPVTGTRDVETMGRVLCEANAAGIPVLASRSGGIPSVITDGVNGLLFDAENIEQLINRVVYLKNNPDVQNKIVEQGLSRAREEFDWSSILNAHRRVFHQLAS